MMKTYLNREERTDMIYFCSLLGFLDKKFLQDWCNRDNIISKDEKKYIRTAVSYMDKVMISMMERLGRDFVERLVAEIKDSEIFVMPKTRAQIKKKEFMEQDNVVASSLDDVYELAGIALTTCNQCTETRYEQCKLRKCAMDLNIPAYNEYATNKCQYLPDGVKYQRVV